MSVALIITVDTEEDNAWEGDYPTAGHTVKNLRGVERFQALCDRFGVRPTYLVDAPVVQDERAAGLLREIAGSGRCEIGAHVHPWCNPPLRAPVGAGGSYLCNLPPEIQQEKLAWITDALYERLDARPRSFRAGRYGLDSAGLKILSELGYRVDSSVLPFSDYSDDGGPSFERAPCVPYFPADNDLCRAARNGAVLEVPVSVGFNRVDFARVQSLRNAVLARQWLRRLRLVGLMDRTRVLQRIKFSPEQSDAARMKRLVTAYHARGAPAMVMLLHSSSLVPGCAPYVPTAERLDALYRDLEETLEHCLAQRGMVAYTLTEFAEAYCPATEVAIGEAER